MCYQLPGSITHDGHPISGGPDINALDRQFARKIYPSGGSFGAGPMPGWDLSEDVSVEEALDFLEN